MIDVPLVAANALWIVCAAWLVAAASERVWCSRAASHGQTATTPPTIAARIADAAPVIVAAMAPFLGFYNHSTREPRSTLAVDAFPRRRLV